MATRRLSGIATSSSVPDNGGDHSGGGSNGGGGVYVDDVFSTYLYKGTGAAQDIENGIDLEGEGGMVWIKNRTSGTSSDFHVLFDTERGAKNHLYPNENWAEWNGGDQGVTEFLDDGFGVAGLADSNNKNGEDYASWTFRKAPKFFDVVTYTGQDGHTQPHNLGAVPGMIIIKNTNTTRNWIVWHRDVTGHLWLNDPREVQSFEGITNVTDKSFDLADWTDVSNVGQEYVAYVFAHDDSDESMIKCGSFVGAGSGVTVDDVGFEPQFLLVKAGDASSNWGMYDSMRGTGSPSPALRANTADAEASANLVTFTSNGFTISGGNLDANIHDANMVYMAIRRPNKPAEEFDPEELFGVINGSAGSPGYKNNIVTDMAFHKPIGGGTDQIGARLIQGKTLAPSGTDAEVANSKMYFDYQNGYWKGDRAADVYSWGWRRAPGFFDVVAYTGEGGAANTIPHNLGVKPEMMWVKRRDWQDAWYIYSEPLGAERFLNFSYQGAQQQAWAFNDTEPTDTHFTAGSNLTGVNQTFVVYLFASVPGVSKVGSYTGTGAEIDVNCGFTTGARFVLIKRTDGNSSENNWYFWDTERGITTGNDPYLLLNTTDAQVTNTDYIDPLSSGFKVTASAPAAINASGGNYLFYAIA